MKNSNPKQEAKKATILPKFKNVVIAEEQQKQLKGGFGVGTEDTLGG